MTDPRGSQDAFILGDKEVIPGSTVFLLALHYNTIKYISAEQTYLYERQCNSRKIASPKINKFKSVWS